MQTLNTSILYYINRPPLLFPSFVTTLSICVYMCEFFLVKTCAGWFFYIVRYLFFFWFFSFSVSNAIPLHAYTYINWMHFSRNLQTKCQDLWEEGGKGMLFVLYYSWRTKDAAHIQLLWEPLKQCTVKPAYNLFVDKVIIVTIIMITFPHHNGHRRRFCVQNEKAVHSHMRMTYGYILIPLFSHLEGLRRHTLHVNYI